MDTEARLVIFIIVENNHGVLSKWRPRRVLYVNGVGLAMLVLPMLIEDRTIVGASIEIERMPLT